jgi:hypothetical protein
MMAAHCTRRRVRSAPPQLESVQRMRGVAVAAAEAAAPADSDAGGERLVCGFRVRTPGWPCALATRGAAAHVMRQFMSGNDMVKNSWRVAMP